MSYLSKSKSEFATGQEVDSTVAIGQGAHDLVL